MKFTLPNAVTSTVSRQILIGAKHSPTILFVGGVVGVVAATVTACRSTLKLETVLNDIQDDKDKAKTLLKSNNKDYSEADYKKDMAHLYIQSVVKVTKLYGPSILLGALSIAALTGSHNILSKRNAALTAAYAAVEESYRQYRARVINEYGSDKDRELRYGSETTTRVVEDTNGPKKFNEKHVRKDGATMYSRFFEEFNQNWSPTPEYNVMFLRAQQNHANDVLQAKGHILLNDVYDMLGMDRSKAGCVVGWVRDGDGDGFVDFGIWNDDTMTQFHNFITGREGAILLDFNVDGVVYDKI